MGYCCLMSLLSYRGCQFLLMDKLEYPEKTINILQITDKVDHNSCIKYTSQWAGIKWPTLIVIGSDCRCISYYPTIDARASPFLFPIWESSKSLHKLTLNQINNVLNDRAPDYLELYQSYLHT